MDSIIKHRLRRRIFSDRGSEFRTYAVDEGPLREQARRLHAEAYLYKGFIYEKDVNKKGLIRKASDPHQHHSQYFVVVEVVPGEEIVRVTGRHIYDSGKGFKSFPILYLAKIEKQYMQVIQSYSPKNCVEVSGLAKSRGTKMIATLMLYRVMWQYSLIHGDQLWLMACSPPLFRRLKQIFGKTIQQIGEPTEYIGEDVIPAMLQVKEAKIMLEEEARTWNPIKRTLYRQVLAFFNANNNFLVSNNE